MEREREREAAGITGTRVLHHDPYRYKYTNSFAGYEVDKNSLLLTSMKCLLAFYEP